MEAKVKLTGLVGDRTVPFAVTVNREPQTVNVNYVHFVGGNPEKGVIRVTRVTRSLEKGGVPGFGFGVLGSLIRLNWRSLAVIVDFVFLLSSLGPRYLCGTD